MLIFEILKFKFIQTYAEIVKKSINILTRNMNLMSLTTWKFAKFQNKDYCLKADQFVQERQYSFHGFFEDL